MFFQLRDMFVRVMMVFLFAACSEGDTRDIYEFVLFEDLGITNIILEKEHDDFLREGRELQIRALATLESGAIIDISNEVRWSSSDSESLKSLGVGLFRAQLISSTTTVQALADFAGFHLVADVTISVASLVALEVGPAKDGVVDQCQIDSSISTQNQCSALSLCVLGSYAGELEKREETLYVGFTGTQASEFASGKLINAEIDLESGAILESIYASLDGLDSPVITITHEQNLGVFEVESTSGELAMGASLSFTTPALASELDPYLQWSYQDFNLGEPSASGQFTGSIFKADAEEEYVLNFDDYGVDIFASCSGKLSSPKSLLISSDVGSLKIDDDGSSVDVLIGGGSGPELTLNAYDENNDVLALVDGEISWYVCDLTKPVCDPVDIQTEKSSRFDLIPESGEAARDLRIEAIYHGRKAVREDYSFVTN